VMSQDSRLVLNSLVMVDFIWGNLRAYFDRFERV